MTAGDKAKAAREWREWREVDGVLGLHPVEARPPLGNPPSWEAKPFPCVLPDFATDPPEAARAAIEAAKAALDTAEAETKACADALDEARRRERAAYLAWVEALQAEYRAERRGA